MSGYKIVISYVWLQNLNVFDLSHSMGGLVGQHSEMGLSLENGRFCPFMAFFSSMYMWGLTRAKQEPKHIHPTACTL